MERVDNDLTFATLDLAKVSREEAVKYRKDIYEALKFYGKILEKGNVYLEFLEYEFNKTNNYLGQN